MSLETLHAAVCAAPDDDAPRVAYADFLAPYDPPRAELVRIQLARAADERAHKRTLTSPGVREAQLLREHGAEWARYMRMFLVPPANDPDNLACEFERGFIAYARIAIENVVGLGAKLYQYAPIQHLDVTPGQSPGDGDPARVLGAPGLERLDSISLAGLGLDDDAAVAVAECAALARATWIDLRDNRIGKRGVLALARSPRFANKVRVLLKGNPCDPIEMPYFDYDGSVADLGYGTDPAELEAELGHPVPWFHYGWANRSAEPDRFHARWFARGT
jgi:uncharacterized protein (TIGR02996 family)